MPAFSAFIVYGFVWFLTLLVILPLRLKTQGEMGEVTPGTPSSAPSNPQIRKKMIITTVVATLLWAGIVWIILSGVVTVENMDVINRWIHS
ncbi:DUF1467 family protein [Pararhodobacter sp.]|uniref:DUF1467 family protein n=1 Tax=Pararhodobacter sp. TaxID=2127056 RepID=UPI002AFF8F93|nr:DUF1467 family protein [Pararhodobacter sp.]